MRHTLDQNSPSVGGHAGTAPEAKLIYRTYGTKNLHGIKFYGLRLLAEN